MLNLLEMKCVPLVEKSNALREDNEDLRLKPFREDLSESRKGAKRFEKAEAMLENLKNNLTEFKNLIEKVTCENKQLEIEHISLVENFGNPGVDRNNIKGTDGIVKGNKVVHEIGCKSSKTNLAYEKGHEDQLKEKHPPLVKEGNAFIKKMEALIWRN